MNDLTSFQGVLVECDPSIKAIILKINNEQGHDIIIEDIDDEHVLIKSAKEDELKRLLKEVRLKAHGLFGPIADALQALKDTVKEAEESTDED